MGRECKECDYNSLEMMIRAAFRGPNHGPVRSGGRHRARDSDIPESDRRWVEVNEAVNPLWGSDAPGRAVARERSVVCATFGALRLAHVAVALVCTVTAIVTARLGSTSEVHLASIAAYEVDLSGRYRDGGSGPRSNLAVGASLLVAAQNRGWSGFHPDELLVDAAGQYLEGAYRGTHDPFQRAEASFFRAKAALMIGDTNLATRWLRICLAQRVEDYNADARALLKELEGRNGRDEPGGRGSRRAVPTAHDQPR